MMGATYYKEMAVALPGQVSDTSRYNIDGACVLADTANLKAGLAVFVDAVESDGVKQVKRVIQGKTAYGVAIRSHFATINEGGQAVYVAGDGVNVMTVGRVWMIASTDFTPAFGTGLHINPNTGELQRDNSNNAVTPAGWTFAGGKTVVDNGGSKIYLLEVQLHQL